MESFKESMYWQIWADGCSLHKRFYGIREDDTPAWEQLFQAVEAFGKKYAVTPEKTICTEFGTFSCQRN